MNNQWPDEFLESMRQQTDPLADAVVDDLFAHGETAEVMKLHRRLLAEGGLAQSGDLPPVLARYVEESGRLPDWADPEIIETAEQVLMSHGFIAFVILACASLPECYSDARGVPALILTHKLTQHTKRRIFETSQFMIDVMSPGGLKPGGKGILATQMVRLMHASIRHLILHVPDSEAEATANEKDFVSVLHQTHWDMGLGKPLNQEDMAYTLQTFAWVTVRSLRTLDANLTADEEWAVIHLWNVVGHILGIRRDLMPTDVAEAEYLFETIKKRVAYPSPESRALEKALLDFLHDYWTRSFNVPGTKISLTFDELNLLPPMMTRELVGSETAELLGVPEVGHSLKEKMTDFLIQKALREAVHVNEKAFHKFSKSRQVADVLFRGLLTEMTEMPRGWERELFSIPNQLSDCWGVPKT